MVDHVIDLEKRRLLKERIEEIEDLPAIAYGETQVGILDDDEKLMFVALAEASEIFEQVEREFAATSLEAVADTIRHSGEIDPTNVKFKSAEDAETFFKAYADLAYHRAVWRRHLGEKYGFGRLYGVRIGWALCALGNRYDLINAARAGN